MRVPYVATRDIGRASAAVLRDAARYAGAKIDLVSAYATGAEVAAALSSASGVHCRWALAMPKFVQGLLLPDLAVSAACGEAGDGEGGGRLAFVRSSRVQAMARFFERGVPALDLTTFHALVPKPVTLAEYFAGRGQWAGGEKFAPLPGGAAPPAPPPGSGWAGVAAGAVVVAVVAVAAVAAAPRLRGLWRKA